MSLILGIDPGITGALAVLSPTGELERLHLAKHDGRAEALLIDALRAHASAECCRMTRVSLFVPRPVS
jgi:hypothetical protein